MGTTSTGSEPRRTCIGARIDIETKSATPIDAGSYRYAEDLHFEALVISYSPIWRYPGGTERLGAIRTLDQRNAQQVATFQRILTEPRFQKHAFNANFERVALSRWLNMPTGFYLDPENWRCSAVLANVHGVFGTLDEVARAVRSPIQKDPEGRRLIKLFSVPETRKRTGVPDNNPFHSPGPGDCWCGQNHVADFGKFRAYCENDVRTEALVAASFPGMPPELQAEYDTRRVNLGIAARLTPRIWLRAARVDIGTAISASYELSGRTPSRSPMLRRTILRTWSAKTISASARS